MRYLYSYEYGSQGGNDDSVEYERTLFIKVSPLSVRFMPEEKRNTSGVIHQGSKNISHIKGKSAR